MKTTCIDNIRHVLLCYVNGSGNFFFFYASKIFFLSVFVFIHLFELLTLDGYRVSVWFFLCFVEYFLLAIRSLLTKVKNQPNRLLYALYDQFIFSFDFKVNCNSEWAIDKSKTQTINISTVEWIKENDAIELHVWDHDEYNFLVVNKFASTDRSIHYSFALFWKWSTLVSLRYFAV